MAMDYFRAAFAQAGVGLCIVDPNGQVVHANRRWLQSTGLTPEEAIGRDILDLLPLTREFRSALHARARTGETVLVPRHRQIIEARETWWDGSVAPLTMETGTGLLITAREITAQVQEEERSRALANDLEGQISECSQERVSTQTELERLFLELGTQHRLLQAVLDNAPVAIAVMDSNELRLKLYNNLFQRFMGESFRGQDLTGLRPRDYVPEAMRAEVLSGLSQVAETGEPFANPEYRFEDELGTTYWRWSVQRLPDEEGRDPDLLVLLANITDLVEARLRAEELAIELDATIESIVDGIVVYDPAGSILRMNQAARSILGYSAEEERLSFIQRGDLDVIRTAQGDPFPLADTPVARALEGQAVSGVMGVFRRTNRWASMSAAPVSTAQGKMLGVVGVFTDVTAVQELKQLQEETASVIAHDLRSPLTVITGYASMLKRVLASRGLEAEAGRADMIVQSSQRMNSMLQELSDLARLEVGKMELHREATDTCAVISNVVEQFRAVDQGSRIVVDCDDPLPAVDVDRGRYQRVIENLIGNAIKYSPDGSPIILRTARHNGSVLVSVSDQGLGIPPDELPMIFDRFFRASTSRRSEGLGLGLHISRRIVEAHGGRIWAESKEGKGSTFYLELPLSGRGTTPRPPHKTEKG